MADTVYSNLFAKNKIHEAERKQKIEINKQIKEQQRLQEERENAGFWEKLGASVADIFTEVGGGLLKGIEGIFDAGISIAGGIGSVFGADTQWAEDIVKYDATNELYYKGFENDLTKNSWLNDAPIAKDILGGVGQMLPTIALSTVGLAPLGIAGIVAGAGGSGVEESLNEGAEFNQALLYGGTQAGIEGLIETVTAGMGKGITAIGKSVGRETGKTVAKSIGKTMLEEGISESIEEGLTALVNPLSKTIYKGSDSLDVYNDITFYLDAGQQALVGGIVGAISAGGSGAIVQHKVGGKTNYNISQSVNELKTLELKENNLWKNNKLDIRNIEEIDIQRQAELQNISEKLQGLDEVTRKETIEKYNLSSNFNEDGSIIVNNNADLQKTDVNRKPLKSDNIEAYSPNVRNIVLNHAPTSNKLSDSAVKAKQFITTLDSNAKIVIPETLGDAHAYYDSNSKIFYISNEATTEQIASKIAGHEFTHSLEGTKEYKKLADYILNSTEDLKIKIEHKKIQYKDVNKSVKQGENGDKVALYEAQTEIVAEEMGKLLSDPKAIERIVNQNKSLTYKIMQWIKDVLTKLTKRGIKGEYYNYIRTAEKLYANAVKKSIGGISLSDVAALSELEKLAQLEEQQNLLVNTENNNYNTVKDGILNEKFAEARYSRKDSNEKISTGSESIYQSRGRNVSVFFNDGRIGRLHEVFKDEKLIEKTEEFFDSIYENPKTETQKTLVWHAKNEDIKLYFGHIKQQIDKKTYFFDGSSLIVEENSTEQDLVDILNIEKPTIREVDYNKVAHISNERWNKFLEWKPNSYLTRIPIQQFLDMTTNGYVDQRQINARSSQISKNTKVENIKYTQEPIYLEVDFNNNKVVNHEGRHRLTALLNAGNTLADIFIVPTTNQTFESKANIEIKGQFTNNKYSLGLVKAQSNKFKDAIKYTFLRDDGNIRYALKDEKINTRWGIGSSTDGIDVKQYNLIHFKNDESLIKFEELLREVEHVIKSNNEKDTFKLRTELFNVLQKQEGRVYSKLIEINNAISLAWGEFIEDPDTNIIQSFIENLGYNGLFVKEDSKTGFKSVVYDINKKRKNLLDFSPERARERLDKAIKLFGETKNPQKAGWLLSDGRFVDYNRDSENILKDSSDFEVDYNDHHEIEKVYDTKRGYDAVDSFMAEGNIRLMPEVGGIELRNKPTIKQIYSLIKYIDELIDKTGITLDLREVNTTENVAPNSIYYNSDFKASTIIRDINVFYETGEVSRVINGVRFALKDNLGNELSEQQVEYFKDSKVRDDDGNLLVVYHGSRSLFNVFDISKSGESNKVAKVGFWFTENKQGASNFANDIWYGESDKEVVYSVYLNLQNPKIYETYETDSSKIENFRNEIKSLEESIKEIDSKYSWMKTNFKVSSLFNIVKQELKRGLKNLDKNHFENHAKAIGAEDLFSELWGDAEKIISLENRKQATEDDYYKYKASDGYEQFKTDLYLFAGMRAEDANVGGIGMAIPNSNEAIIKFVNSIKEQGYDGIIIKNTEYDKVTLGEGKSNNQYVAFYPNQIKNIDNKTPTNNNDIRYSLKSEYTETEYNNFGWVRANDILSTGQYKNFTEKFAKAVVSGVKFNKTQDGYYMIPVSDIYNKELEGVENAIVFAKGTIESPKILKILKIDLYNETGLDYLRREIYASERRGIQQTTGGVLRLYSSTDYGYKLWSDQRYSIEEIGDYSDDRLRGRSNQTARKIKSIHFNEDGRQEITYYDKRLSLKGGDGDYNYSKGQIAKYVAEHSKLKAYSKTDAEQIINTIVSTQLGYGNKYGDLSNKTKNQVINTLWHALNTNNEGYRAKAVLDIADYIINNAVMEDIYGDSSNEADLHIVGVLKNYLHKVDLNGIKGEIKYHYDNDNSPYLIWGKRTNESGQAPDQIAQEIAKDGIFIEAVTDADIFFEIDRMYRNATKSLKKVSKEKLADIASKEDLAELKQRIAKELLISFDDAGHKTMFANTIEKYTSKISQLKQAVKDIKAFNNAKNNAISTIERLRDEFVKSKPAGWNVPQQVADFVKKIARVETWRNNISKTAREHLLELNNQIDLVMDETQQQIYPFRETLRELGSGKGELTTQELQTLDTILIQFAWQLRNYNKVNFEDKIQDVDTIAAQGVNESKQAKTILRSGSNILIKFKNKVYTNPYDRLAEIGLYRENSIAVRLYKDMLQGDRNRAKLLYEVNQSFNSFFDKNKGYLKELQKTITLGDVVLTKRQALALYCTSLREQGKAHLFNQGYNSGVVRILDNKYSTQGKALEAFAKGKDITITADMIAQIKDSLTESDKAYLEVVDNFFNKISKQAKNETDQKLYGITNIEEGYYFPLKVSSDKIYTEAGQNNLNVNQYILDLGMNKSTKPHASNKIVIDGIDNIISNHLQSLSLYYGYAVPLTAYNRIMNRQVMEFEGADSTSNMRGEIQKIDVDFEGYMNRLWQDVQGIRRSDKGFVSSLLSKIRWAGANSALGANPKVLVTQTLSLAAGISEFNPKYVAKGMGHFFGEKQKLELAKYSSLMWERMQIGNSVDIAEIRQIGKEIGSAGKITARATKFLNDFTTKPISWMDSNVIQSLWFAAQYEVADTKGKGFEFGTEANKVEAGKRLDEVVFRTQQTSDPLGRSEWMRSQKEFVKFARMFTGDALQLTGRLISSVNKYNIAKKMIQSGDAGLVEQGQKMLSSAKKGVAKASSAFILNQTMLLAIAMAFKWLKGKDDEEEWSEIAKNEAIANIIGLIPFGGDIYDKLLGYEPTNMAYTALSNAVEVVETVTNEFVELITGEYQDPVKRNVAIRKTALSISRLLGIPAQNLESYINGVIGHVSPGTREEYESLFKTKSNVQYLKKIQQATEDGNEVLADTIINIMFDSRTGKIKDDKVLAEKRVLIELGYDVIPKSVGNSITYDGVEYALTSRQHAQFMKIYSQANDKVKSMINTYSFEKLENGAKSKAMNFIYNYYYNLAIENLLGEDLEMKTILFAEAIPIEQLAMAIAQAQLYTADTDRNGKSISGTKKAKVQSFIQSLKLTATQKYMIMGYLGYSNKYGEALVKAYINRLNLTKTQKQELFKMSGYAA